MSLAHQIVPAAKLTTKTAVERTITGTLPGMVKAAAEKLASASEAAEVLDARDAARLTYTTAQISARIAKAKGAHDKLVAAAHRAQADALEIEAAAKRRLADEYDAAQPEDAAVAGRPKKSVPVENAFSAKAVGLTRKQVHEARQVRDAELAQPGIVRQTLDDKLAAGEEPTRAAVNAAVAKVFGKTQPIDPPTAPRIILDEIIALWCEAGPEDRDGFIAYLRMIGWTITETNSPETVNETHQRPSINDEPSPEAGPQAEASLAGTVTGTLADREGRLEGEAASADLPTNSQSSEPTSSQAETKTGAVVTPPAAAPVAPIKTLSKADQIRRLRPHCQRPGSELCGGYGQNHCSTCKKAAAESEAK